MASARPAAAPPRSSAGDKEVNVQVLLRCRRVCRHLHTTDCLSAVRPPAPAHRLAARLSSNRPTSAEEVKQRVPQVVKCNDIAREVWRACDRALRCGKSAP